MWFLRAAEQSHAIARYYLGSHGALPLAYWHRPGIIKSKPRVPHPKSHNSLSRAEARRCQVRWIATDTQHEAMLGIHRPPYQIIVIDYAIDVKYIK
jgi:hypothetical protein